MKIYDISVSIPEAPVYPGDCQSSLCRVSDMKNGAIYNLTEMSICVHTGTHADAPLHFINNGLSIEKIDPAIFCGQARVVTVYKKNGQIEAEDLKGFSIKPGERLLIKTRSSIDGHILQKDFYSDYCALTVQAAEYLVSRGIALLGIDYASAGAGENTVSTHRVLLGAGIPILEWLNLTQVPDGEYFLSAAPLKITEAEGAPVRALLFEL